MILGDSHGNLEYMRQAINLATTSGCDAIFQVGDFGIWDHIPKGKVFLDETDAMLRSVDLSLAFCDGNHENFTSLEQYPIRGNGFREVRSRIFHAPRGHRWKVDNVRFMAFGGAHSIDGPGGIWKQNRGPVELRNEQTFEPEWVDLGGWWPQETIKQKEVDAVEPEIVDVLFSHECPAGIKIPGIDGYPAGDRQRELLRQVTDKVQPQLVVHGHYHRFHQGQLANGTRIVGLAADVSKSGQYCFIDTDPFALHVPKWPTR